MVSVRQAVSTLIWCLPFDPIGTWHLGIDVGSSVFRFQVFIRRVADWSEPVSWIFFTNGLAVMVSEGAEPRLGTRHAGDAGPQANRKPGRIPWTVVCRIETETRIKK
jgi:hypothetical protein